MMAELLNQGVLQGQYADNGDVQFAIVSTMGKRAQIMQLLTEENITITNLCSPVVQKTKRLLEKNPPSLEKWQAALLGCRDEDFRLNLSVFTHGEIERNYLTTRMRELGPQIVMRYHEISMGEYR